MVDSMMIEKAMAAHKEWKIRLENAIKTGKSEFSPAIVKTDNSCEFGKWLDNLPSADKSSLDYQTVKVLHAEFHKVAADILQFAVMGKKEEAIKKFSFGGTYGLASSKLMNAMFDWKKKL